MDNSEPVIHLPKTHAGKVPRNRTSFVWSDGRVRFVQPDFAGVVLVDLSISMLAAYELLGEEWGICLYVMEDDPLGDGTLLGAFPPIPFVVVVTFDLSHS